MHAPASWRRVSGEVQVWLADTEQLEIPLRILEGLLSPFEVSRAERFLLEEHRFRYVARRGWLRLILSRYLTCGPAALDFGCGEHGKPFLASHPELCFSVAHSDRLVLLAVAWASPVGVDLEKVTAAADGMAIADRFFSARERSELRRLPEEQRQAAFLRGWTRKEAYVKALGTGLACPLDSFTVSLAAQGVSRLLESRENPQEVEAWTFLDLPPIPGFAASLVTRGTPKNLQCWKWYEQPTAASPWGVERSAEMRDGVRAAG
ncbi:MAG: 4'-phosphopantetheinyl transferase superfamily protein [Acidobacteriota bacterium]